MGAVTECIKRGRVRLLDEPERGWHAKRTVGFSIRLINVLVSNV